MTKVTISLDKTMLRQARVRAIQQGTSLSAKVREFLAAYASGTSANTAADPASDLLRLMEQVRNEIAQNKNLPEPTPPLRAGAQTLYTEDRNHGQRFGTLVVENPFQSLR